MKKVLALAALFAFTSVPVVVAAQGFNRDAGRRGFSFNVRPSPRDLASGCALAMLASGAYTDLGADTLVKYCVDVAKGIQYADYRRDQDAD